MSKHHERREPWHADAFLLLRAFQSHLGACRIAAGDGVGAAVMFPDVTDPNKPELPAPEGWAIPDDNEDF